MKRMHAAGIGAVKIILDALRSEGLKDREMIDMLFEIQRSDISIPVDVFRDRRLGPLEAMTIYLKDSKSLTYHDIAVLLKRDDRTIWSTYKKAKRKVGKR
jgi:hypothetical protein